MSNKKLRPPILIEKVKRPSKSKSVTSEIKKEELEGSETETTTKQNETEINKNMFNTSDKAVEQKIENLD